MALNAIAKRSSVCAASSRRSSVVVKASAENRRAVLGGLLAGAVVSVSGSAFAAATPVDIIDDRKAKATGFEIIYEARDLDLPQNVRDGLTQARTSLADTIKRVKASESRIDSQLEGSIKSAYWTEAREELRRQVGTLRFDLNALASTKPKDLKKEALAANKEFIAKVEALDLALRKKDGNSALAALSSTKSALDSALAKLL